jgi:hypothetical protein
MMDRSRCVILVALLGTGGCAARATQTSLPAEKPPLTIAVLSFGGTNTRPSEAEDGCVMALLEAGYRVVDRARIVEAIPNENDVDFSVVGRTLGADLLVDGGWTRDTGAPPDRLESRLISTHSANILGTAQTRGHVAMTRALGKKLCRDLIGQLP